MTSKLIKAGRIAANLQVGSKNAKTARGRTPSATTPCSDETPEITLHKQGDIVDAIEITCPCGRTLILECEYPEERS